MSLEYYHRQQTFPVKQALPLQVALRYVRSLSHGVCLLTFRIKVISTSRRGDVSKTTGKESCLAPLHRCVHRTKTRRNFPKAVWGQRWKILNALLRSWGLQLCWERCKGNVPDCEEPLPYRAAKPLPESRCENRYLLTSTEKRASIMSTFLDLDTREPDCWESERGLEEKLTPRTE